MYRAIAWLKEIKWQQITIALFAVLTLVLGQISNILPAQAASLTPEAKQFQVDGKTNYDSSNVKSFKDKNAELGQGLKGSAQKTTEKISEKLNLQESLPESTRDFIKQVKGEDVEVTEPIPVEKRANPQNS